VTEETLADPLFGAITVYRSGEKPKGLLWVWSDSTGWDSEMRKTAEAMAGLSYVVAGADTPDSLRHLASEGGSCTDVAKPVLALGAKLADRFGISGSLAPIVLGFGAGADLTYAALAQALPTAFHAGISVNFCPRFAVPKNLCAGRTLKTVSDAEGMRLVPSADLGSGWFLFQSEGICTPDARAFAADIGNANWVDLQGSELETIARAPAQSELLALLQWLDPDIAGQIQAKSDLGDLPLREIPAAKGSDDRMAVMLSGDGGWAALDRGIAAQLADRGIPVVGWDSLSYFWNTKTPERAAADLERVIRHYSQAWHKSEVILIGYSFGAGVLPFMTSRLPPDLHGKVQEMALLGLGKRAMFEFHLRDWLGSGAQGLPTAPEVARISWTKRLCLHGAEETESGCPELANRGVAVVRLPGDHHFNGDCASLVKRILDPL
jgi:type IV secretory pathway VirJ component